MPRRGDPKGRVSTLDFFVASQFAMTIGSSLPFIARAPAKVNLTLHVLGRRADGFHDLDSLVAFAGVADRLAFTPGCDLALTVHGPTAPQAGAAADNLVLRAARHLAARVPHLETGHFALEKRLPVAAGIGGGSSDAAAALRLLAQHNALAPDDACVIDAARATGSDVPVCLDPRARTMRGAGETIGPPLAMPKLFAVLVNPRVAVETAPVFKALGLTPGTVLATRTVDVATVSLATIIAGRNDLEAPAKRVAPVIGDVLVALAALPGSRLARMSGSGATCFALFDTCHAAARGARLLRIDHADWWITPTVLR